MESILKQIPVALRYPAVAYGTHQSLYCDLEPRTVQALEDAILLRRIEAYPAAMAIFDMFGAPEKYTPVIAVEYGLALGFQGRCRDAADAYREALSYAASDPETADRLSEPQYRLLRVMLGYAETLSEGTFIKARDAMHELKAWLGAIPVEDYTDLQVSCITMYYQLLMTAKLGLQFLDEARYSDLPYTHGPPYSGIRRLRDHLQGQGRLLEAYTVLLREREYIPTDDRRVELIESFVDSCESCEHSREPLWLLGVRARLLLSAVKAEAGDSKGAREAAVLAESKCQKFIPRAATDVWHYFRLPFDFAGAVADSSFPEVTGNLTQVYEKLLSVAGDAAIARNITIENNTIYRASVIARILTYAQAGPSWPQEYLALHARLQASQREVGNVAQLLLICVEHLLPFSFKTKFGFCNALDWIRDFKGKHGDFAFTKWLLIMEDFKGFAAWILQSPELREQVNNDTKRIADRELALWAEVADPKVLPVGPSLNRHQSKEGQDAEEDYILFPAPAEGFESVLYERAQFHRYLPALHVRDEGGIKRRSSLNIPNSDNLDPVWNRLLVWMQIDCADSTLSVETTKRILPTATATIDGTDAAEMNAFLRNLSDTKLRAILVPGAGNMQYYQQWGSIFDLLRSWLFTAEKYPVAHRHFLLNQIQLAALRAVASSSGIRQEKFELVYRESVRYFELQPSIIPEVRAYFKKSECYLRTGMSNSRRGKYSTVIRPSEDQLEDMQAAAQVDAELIQSYRDAGDIGGEAGEYLASSLFRLLAKGMGVLEFSVDDIVEDLAHAECIFNNLRRDFSVLRGLDGIQEQHFMNSAQSTTLYQTAICALWLAPQTESRDTKMWNWIQKAKARDLAEFVGLGRLSSDVIIERGAISEESIALLQEERSLLTSMLQKSPLEKAGCLEAHRTLLERMKEKSELANILATRDGVPFSASDLDQVCASVGTNNVLFVDWFITGESGAGVPGIVMVTARKGSAPTAWKIDLGSSAIQNWILDNLEDGPYLKEFSDQESRELLHQLDSLVAPLAEASGPGDTLVLCPTKLLHRLPLHALSVDGTLLVRRNPIVYTHSLSLLRYCFLTRRAESTRTTRKPWNAAVFCGPGADFGRSATLQLGQLLDTTPIIDTDITKERFLGSIRDTSLLHFHGHCEFAGQDDLEQYLQLNDHEYLSVREVFGLPSCTNSFHATFLACHSGNAKLSELDNSLGFVTAFLHAGATSTVSTLWRIGDEDAALFSVVFAEAVRGARMAKGGEGGKKAVVDIAKATQRAALSILDSGRAQPYHWAAFVCHGFWLLEV